MKRMKRKTIIAALLPAFAFLSPACASSAGFSGDNAGGDAVAAVSETFLSDSSKIGYLGPEGTYSHEACMRFFGKRANFIPFGTVGDAIDALTRESVDLCVIPQENSIGGPVLDYIDAILTNERLFIVGEVELPISQNLLALTGVGIDDVVRVYSHRQGIVQSASWLSQNLSSAQAIEVSSTAEGARLVSQNSDRGAAAIASAYCADSYGLNVLASDIQGNASNTTRFYVLSKRPAPLSSGKRIAFVATGNAKDLPNLLGEMDSVGMELISIHDRPRGTKLGEYRYLVECMSVERDGYSKMTGRSPFEFRFLGRFDVR